MKGKFLIICIVLAACIAGGVIKCEFTSKKTHSMNIADYMVPFSNDSLEIDQLETKSKMLKIMRKSIVVKDNKLCCTMTIEEFKESGLDESLYSIMLKKIDTFNAFAKTEKIDVEKMSWF